MTLSGRRCKRENSPCEFKDRKRLICIQKFNMFQLAMLPSQKLYNVHIKKREPLQCKVYMQTHRKLAANHATACSKIAAFLPCNEHVQSVLRLLTAIISWQILLFTCNPCNVRCSSRWILFQNANCPQTLCHNVRPYLRPSFGEREREKESAERDRNTLANQIAHTESVAIAL